MTVNSGTAADPIKFLKSLRSVRTFSDQPVPDTVLADILEVGRYSGSAKNSQPWQFIVVRDAAMKQALSQLAPYTGHVAGADLAIVIAMDGYDPELETFDDGKVSERMMLAAAAHGVGSCVATVLTPEPVAALRSLLQVPDTYRLRTLISFGYPRRPSNSESRPSAARNPLTDIVSYERFGAR